MKETRRWSSLGHLFAPLAVLAVVLGAVAVAWVSTTEALEERGVAAAAADLRLAALTVTGADAMFSATGRRSGSDLGPSLALLQGDHERPLHALRPRERARADGLLAEITACGLLLVAPGPADHPPPHGHQELQDLLALAVTSASTKAAAAERRASLSVAGALLVVLLAGWLLVRSRNRARRDRAHAAGQVEVARRLEALLNDSPDIIMVVARDGSITYRSASVDRLLGPGTESTLDDVLDCVDDSDRDALREHVRTEGANGLSAVFGVTTASGDPRRFDVRVSDLMDDALVNGHLVTARDVTCELRLRGDLERQAMLDDLTGLPNRRALEPALQDAHARLQKDGAAAALLILDLDGFKATNDTLGHLAGDRLLEQVARRLAGTIRSDETLLRLGGDEFAVVLPSVPGKDAVLAAAERLLSALHEPFVAGLQAERLGTSIGAAITTGTIDPERLLGQADIALYEAKRAGGDTVVMFEAKMETRAAADNTMSRALRDADFDREFRLVYQPIVDSETGELVGAEALLRWTSPTVGSVGPSDFIPVAEQSGQICAIGTWVIAAVCRQIAAWDDAGPAPGLTVSLNVSPRQLAQDGFDEGLLAAAAAWGVATNRLVLEVTESALVAQDGVVVERLARLRRAGVRIAIDDFGSGYSNLGQLLGVPLDMIKIDRSLLLTLASMREAAGGDPSTPCKILTAIVSIAQELGAPVVCEGVETEEQRSLLRASGVPYLQGYLLG